MTTNPLMPVLPVKTIEGETTAQKRARLERPSNEEIASWILVGGLIIYTMTVHIVSAVIGGLALYLILDRLAQWLSKRIPGMAARTTAVILVTLIGGGFIVGAIALSMSFVQHHVDTIPAMMRQMADILRSTRLWLGGYGGQLIPDVMTDAENIKGAIVVWLKGHADALKVAGSSFSIGLVHLTLGLLLAIVVFFRHVTHHDEKLRGPLAAYLTEKVDRFAHVFSRIASAQIKVSALNTGMIALYLLALMLFGKEIPFTTTLIVITFICGLLPILGNLVSNTVLVILSLGVSEGTAIASLVFVLAISKLQYVLTSRLVGGEVDSQAWEILFAIIVGEAAFGISGVVMAPIVYAFVKGELRQRYLV
jgi:predicted PurR-regulated permease PerM